MPPQFSPLQFAADGAVLLQSTADTLTAWDVTSKRSHYTCPGRLIGVSQSGVAFANEEAADGFGLWNSATGPPQLPTPAVAADWPFEVRYRVHVERVGNGRYQGHWLDILGEHPPHPFNCNPPVQSRPSV